jgi:hypothetical protein
LARFDVQGNAPIRQTMKADSFLLEANTAPAVSMVSPVTKLESATAAALYSSLKLSDILRGCRDLLAGRLALGRLCDAVFD